jgi:hypothetical protein
MQKALLLLWVFFTVTAYADSSSHCKKQEQVVFSCQLESKKIVSVCASKGVTAKTAYLQYRFGFIKKLEMVWPEPAQSPALSATSGTLMYSGGGGAFLRFAKGEYNYTVYTGIGKGWNKEGVAVYKKAKLIANLLCHDLAVSELGVDFFEKAAIPDDKQGFEIP